MHKRPRAVPSTFLLLAIGSFTGPGCMVDEDIRLEDETADQPAERQQLEDELLPADIDQPRAAQDGTIASPDSADPVAVAIQLGEVNGICAQTLSLRNLPGGYWELCTMKRGNHVRPHYTNGGAWAYLEVLNGPCAGRVGWSLKDWISRHCL